MKTERLQLRVTKETKRALEEIAKENCRSLSAQIEYWTKKEGGIEMKYLNNHKEDLFAGRKVSYHNKVYWANMTTKEIYAHSEDEEIAGSISGYKIADITDDWEIVKKL